MPPKSVEKIVRCLKVACEEDCDLQQIDEVSLYRHVREMLDLEREPPELAPAEIVEEQVRLISGIEWTITDIATGETATGRHGSPTQIRAAAKWAWVLFRDFFGEYPPTGDEDSYWGLVHGVLGVRLPLVIERLPPLS